MRALFVRPIVATWLAVGFVVLAYANVDELAVQCSICKHAIVPAVVKACSQSESVDKVEATIEGALRPLAKTHAFEAVSKTTSLRERSKLESAEEEAVVDEHIHEYVEHMLFDTHQSQILYSLVYDYHHYEKRRPMFPRLVEYFLCHCPDSQSIGPHDKTFSRYLAEHMVSRRKVIDRFGGHEAHNIDEIYKPDSERREDL